MTAPRPPQAVQDAVASFIPTATAQGWDTHAGSTGRCWFIAQAFAWHALDESPRFACFIKRGAPRPEDVNNNVVLLRGWVVDFASRAGLNGDPRPWPRVEPLAVYARRFDYAHPDICPTCGGHTRALRSLHAQPCRGPLTPHQYDERLQAMARREATRIRLTAGRSTKLPTIDEMKRTTR